MSDPEQEGEELDTLPGVVQFFAVEVQCLRCVEQGRAGVLRAKFNNPNPLDLEDVEIFTLACQHCSSELGRPMAVAVACIAGETVDQVFGGDDEDAPEDGFSSAEIAAAEQNTGGLADPFEELEQGNEDGGEPPEGS